MDAHYLVDPKMRHNCTFVDFWGVSRETLSGLGDTVTVIGPTSTGSLTAIFHVPGEAKRGVSRIVSETGAIDIRTVQKSH